MKSDTATPKGPSRPVLRRKRGIGAVAALLTGVAVLAGACSGGTGHAAAPQTGSPKSTGSSPARPQSAVAQAETVQSTVVGMHFVQMDSAATPLVVQLEEALSARRAVPPATASHLDALLGQFDAAATRLTSSGKVHAGLVAMVAADEGLARTVPATGGGSAQLSVALGQWKAAEAAMAESLGLRTATH